MPVSFFSGTFAVSPERGTGEGCFCRGGKECGPGREERDGTGRKETEHEGEQKENRNGMADGRAGFRPHAEPV